MRFLNNFNVLCIIRALVLMNVFNSLRKIDKMLGEPRVLSLFPNVSAQYGRMLPLDKKYHPTTL